MNKTGQSSQQSHFSNVSFISSLNNYIPSLVLQQLINRQEKGEQPKLPELQPMETVCLFADISGFTNVSEACAKKGRRGNEELAFVINRYMEGMVKNLGKYGGDIIKFVGDAMIVMWPPENNQSGSPSKETISLTVRKAIQCALDIQREMNNKRIIEGVSSLSVKIGIGYGKCALLYVGGVFNRSEFFTVGESLTLALKSEECASSGGQTIVNESAYKYVPTDKHGNKFYEGEEIINKHGEKFYLIKKLAGEGVKTRSDALLLRSQISSEKLSHLTTQLRACVPAAIIPYLQIGEADFGSENRSLTVMFCSLGVELSSAETNEGMQKIQRIVTTVQQQVYRQQGSVNKLVMDDKGSTLICLWGLTPMSHEDDAARAILTAFNIRKELEKIDNTWCNVGISSGEVFSGIVGTSGSRKEYSVLGDVANLGARIMFWPLKFGQHGKIHVCLNTRTQASNYFSFQYAGHQEFKGKSISIPIFEPIDYEREYQQTIKKLLPPHSYLRVHMSPLTIERPTEAEPKKPPRNKLVGDNQKTILADLRDEIVEFFLMPEPDTPLLIAIRGETGSGKTLMARCLCDEIADSHEFENVSGKLPIFTSSLNSETELNFLNSWRPILRMMFTWYCKKENMKKDQLLKVILSAGDGYHANEKMFELMADLFGVTFKSLPTQVPQIEPKERKFPFIQRPDYEERQDIIELLVKFVKIVIGEIDDVSLDIQSSIRLGQRRGSSDGDMMKDSDQPPFVVILDTCQLMDAPSWQLYEAIRDDCYRICLILLMQTNDDDELRINPEAKKEFELVWQSKNMEDLREVDMPTFDEESLSELLIAQASSYQDSFKEEVRLMTQIVDPAKTIKSKTKSAWWVTELQRMWQLENKYVSIDKTILKTIIKLCGGNPYLCMAFFVQLLQNGFIMTDSSGQVIQCAKFKHCLYLNDFTQVPIPRFAVKINCSYIDRFLNSVQQKPNKRPGEFQNAVKSLVLMKSATVLGDEFELKALMAINPMQYALQLKQMKSSLRLLETNNFIEILDESDQKNSLCRFNKKFLRETLYQIMLYSNQQKTLHASTGEFMQKQLPRKHLDPEVQAGVLKQHMLISQDKESEDDLSIHARTALMVRRIQNILSKDHKAIVKKGYIYKQGAGANRKQSKRLVTLSSNHFRWYHNEEELKSHTYLGSIPLIYVYQVVSSKLATGNSTAMCIGCSQWNSKDQKEEGKRDFFFGADSTLDRDDWMIAIDFMRTKAIYDQYAQKNIPVQFPLRTAEEDREGETDNGKDMNTLLYDFPEQFKSGTSMVYSTQQSNVGAMASTVLNVTKDHRTPRLSVMKQQTMREGEVTAADILPKLKLLYKMGAVSFLHHLNQTSAKMTFKQQQARIGSFSDHASVTFSHEVEKLTAQDQSKLMHFGFKSNSTDENARKSSSQQSEVEYMRQFHQGDENKRQDGRRSSSISADNVTKQKTQNEKKLHIKELIKEVSEGGTSDEGKDLGGASPIGYKTQANSDGLKKRIAKSGSTMENNSSTPPLSQNLPQLNTMNLHKTPPLEVDEPKPSKPQPQLLKQDTETNRQTFAQDSQDFGRDFSVDDAGNSKKKNRRQPSIEIKETIGRVDQSGYNAIMLSSVEHQEAIKSGFNSTVRHDVAGLGSPDLSKVQQPLADQKRQSLGNSQQQIEQQLKMQEMIQQQIRQGMNQMIQQNQAMFQQQQQEINNFMQAQSALNQSMQQTNQPFLSVPNQQTRLSMPLQSQSHPGFVQTQSSQDLRSPYRQAQSISGRMYDARATVTPSAYNHNYYIQEYLTPNRRSGNNISGITSSKGRESRFDNSVPVPKADSELEDPIEDPDDFTNDINVMDPSRGPTSLSPLAKSEITGNLTDNELTQQIAVGMFQNKTRDHANSQELSHHEDLSTKTVKRELYTPQQQMRSSKPGAFGQQMPAHLLKNMNVNIQDQRQSQLANQMALQQTLKNQYQQQVANSQAQMNVGYQPALSDNVQYQQPQLQQSPLYSRSQQQLKNQTPTLLHFPEERLYFPPPEKWLENEYAMYEEAQHSNAQISQSDTLNSRINEVAFTVRETACSLKGRGFVIPEGSQVQIIEAIPSVKMYKLQYNNQVGIFPMRDVQKIQKQKQQMRKTYSSGFRGSNVGHLTGVGGVQDATIEQMSPIHPVDDISNSQPNFFKEVDQKEMSLRINKLRKEHLAEQSRKLLHEDKQQHKTMSLKVIERQRKKAMQNSGVLNTNQSTHLSRQHHL